jgi:hypothetical protein
VARASTWKAHHIKFLSLKENIECVVTI